MKIIFNGIFITLAVSSDGAKHSMEIGLLVLEHFSVLLAQSINRDQQSLGILVIKNLHGVWSLIATNDKVC